MSPSTDWEEWHRPYDDLNSSLSQRLRVIQGLLDGWLDRTAPEPVRVVSACAGQGRDLLQVLDRRLDADRVSGVLLELDPANAAHARGRAGPFDGIEVREEDAGDPASYAGAVPADLVLMTGVFGNVSDSDVRETIRALPGMCAPDALVIWTRHRRDPDLTPSIRSWFTEAGFEEESFAAPDPDDNEGAGGPAGAPGGTLYAVGAHRLVADPQPWTRTAPLFTFIR